MMASDTDDSSLQPQNGSIYHVVVVGFHHKKGCIVEYAYPPLIEGEPHNSSLVPEEWKYLPFLALPDGAHNFTEDTIYFHLPPKKGSSGGTVYAVSCYRQIEANLLKKKDDDITRETVQKSVVVLSKMPMYGLLHAKLQLITHAYFEEKDFSQKHILKELYDHINLSTNKADESQRFLGLSARNLVLTFKHKIVVLFKLMLLERRVIFHTSPVQKLVGCLMALLSLFPRMIEAGLTECTDPPELKKPPALIEQVSPESQSSKEVSVRPTTQTEDGEKCDTQVELQETKHEVETTIPNISAETTNTTANSSTEKKAPLSDNGQGDIKVEDQNQTPDVASDMAVAPIHDTESSKQKTKDVNMGSEGREATAKHDNSIEQTNISNSGMVPSSEKGDMDPQEKSENTTKLFDEPSESTGKFSDVPLLNSTQITPSPEGGSGERAGQKPTNLNRSDGTNAGIEISEGSTTPETNAELKNGNKFEDEFVLSSLTTETQPLINPSQVWQATSTRARDVASSITARFGSITTSILSSVTETYREEDVDDQIDSEIYIYDDDPFEFGNARLEMNIDSPEKNITASPAKYSTSIHGEIEDRQMKENRSSVTEEEEIDFTTTLDVNEEGFPLSIFTKGHWCLPYVALQQHDLLAGNIKRGFVAGATNVLFKTRQNLSDIVIDIENAEIIFNDQDLRRLLHLSAADLRFADHMVANVIAKGNNDVFLDATGWEGGDEWIQSLFTEYLNGMLALSVKICPDPRDLHDYNESFLAAWKQTKNYRVWKKGEHKVATDAEFSHPFHGQYTVSDMKLRLHHNLQSSERGRKFEGAMANANQAVSNTGKFVGSAITSAKSTFSSWFSGKMSGTPK